MHADLVKEFYDIVMRLTCLGIDNLRYRECGFCDRGNFLGTITHDGIIQEKYGDDVIHESDCLLMKIIARLD